MDKWVVHKFGGSSVADAGCFQRVADIVEKSANPREAVVLSACRGVTDDLLALVSLAEKPHGDFAAALDAIQARPIWRAPCCRRVRVPPSARNSKATSATSPACCRRCD